MPVEDPIELPPLFEPGVAVKKSLINFGNVLGAQVLVAVIGYLVGSPEFQTYLASHISNRVYITLGVATLTAISTGLRNWLKNRNKGQE